MIDRNLDRSLIPCSWFYGRESQVYVLLYNALMKLYDILIYHSLCVHKVDCISWFDVTQSKIYKSALMNYHGDLTFPLCLPTPILKTKQTLTFFI